MLVPLEQEESQGKLVHKVCLECQVQQDLLELLAHWEIVDQMEILDHLESRVQ